MRFQQLTVTLTGAAQQLTLTGNPVQKTPLRSISLQADPANTGTVKVGDSRITSADYAFILPAPESSIPAAPFIPGEVTNGAMFLEDLWVIGTAAETLHVGLWIYT